jgi:hypothetical protein
MLRGFYYAKLRTAVWTAVSGLLTRISELRPRQALSAARSARRASTHGRPAVFRSRSVLRSACESPARVSDDVLTQFGSRTSTSDPKYARMIATRVRPSFLVASVLSRNEREMYGWGEVVPSPLLAHQPSFVHGSGRRPGARIAGSYVVHRRYRRTLRVVSPTAAPTTRIRRTTGRHPCTLIPPQEA